jgi:hypothetical protein
MPVAAATPTLAQGFLPMFRVATAPKTTAAAAQTWAQAYANYVVAGGVIEGVSRQNLLAGLLEQAFRPELAGAGPLLLLEALQIFWLGMTVPQQTGIATAFIPTSPNLNSPQAPTATPEQQAAGLAQVISRLTLGAVKVTVPPGVIVPLL